MPNRDRTPEDSAAGGSDLSEEERVAAGLSRRRDPGDAVPEGVAPGAPEGVPPEAPAALTDKDRAILKDLRDRPKREVPDRG